MVKPPETQPHVKSPESVPTDPNGAVAILESFSDVAGAAGRNSPRAVSLGADVGGGVDRPELRAAIDRACESLYRKQRSDKVNFPGVHWCAELEGDSILSSEYLLMKFILNQEQGEMERRLLPRLANQMRLCQRDDGTWGQYPGAPADVSACVKAYLSLKLMGDDVNAPHMVRAKKAILKLGGAESINTFSNFYLACLGLVSWDACPAIPPQIILAPMWAPFHIRRMAAWTRTMILPLALCSATRPVREPALTVNIDELYVDLKKKHTLNKPWDRRDVTSLNNVFLVIDRLMKLARKVGFTPMRKRSIKLAEQWIVRRMDPRTTEGLGAIFPPMVYVQVAFKKLGYTRDHPLIRQAEADLDAFIIDEPNAEAKLDHTRLQPCFSPVWDTAIAIDALTEAGHSAASDQRLAQACDWLRAREVKLVGDWIENLRPEHRHLRPGIDMACWAFEYRNDWYPDVDDTCMVARALFKAGDRAGETSNRDAAKRAVQWLIAMQNDDGGWAAFDRTKDRPWMEAVPFADHNAMQDPSCSDITGRVIESLMVCGVSPEHPSVQHGVDYLLRTQRSDGCWWGRWGVNYIYGTWQAVNGLRSAGLSPSHPALAKVRSWLLSIQNPDGGFGETANSYLDPRLAGKGPSTASQTAWALMTLLNVLPEDHVSAARAAEYLMKSQLCEDKPPFVASKSFGDAQSQSRANANAGKPSARASELASVYDLSPERLGVYPPEDHRAVADASIDHIRDYRGGWNEHWFTGTGFPKVFYLRYHLYRHSFPLKALARYERRLKNPGVY